MTEKTELTNRKPKVLIGDDSSEYGLTWASLLKKEDMFAVTRKKDGKAILESVRNDMPDFMVVDAKMPGYDAVELMDAIRKEFGKTPLVIVVASHYTPELEKEVMDNGASYFMVKPFEPEAMIKKVLTLRNFRTGNFIKQVNNELVNIEYVVTDIIHQIGIPAHIKGYHYLRTAIILSINDDDMINCVTKLLYPTVARKYNTTSSRVERAIRHAIEIAWDRGDVDTLNGIFGYTVRNTRGKPTNSEFVALIADKLRLQYFPRVEV